MAYYDRLDEAYGGRIWVSYKITDKDKLSKRELEDIEDGYKELYDEELKDTYDYLRDYDDDDYDDLEYDLNLTTRDCEKLIDVLKDLIKEFKNPRVTAGYEITAEVKIRGRDDHDEVEIELNVIKFNGDWMIDYYNLSDGLEALEEQLDKIR